VGFGSHILERLARVVPPRLGATPGSTPWLAFACNTATAAQPLANTVFQKSGTDAYGNAMPGLPGNYGRALLRVQAETNDLWLLFGPTSGVQANSAVVGSNASMHLPAGQERDFEVDPSIDLFLSAVTSNGAGLTATCRIGIVSFHVPGLQQGV
jgi:hypothetical protein